MIIDAIVGNPPYQLIVTNNDIVKGQLAVKNIFHYFQMVSDNIAKRTSLIYPGGRWIHRSGKGLSDFGLNQINDPNLQKIIFYPNASEIFNKQEIADGISIVMKDSEKRIAGFSYTYSSNGSIIESNVPYIGKELMPLNPLDVKVVRKINSFVTSNNIAYLSNSIYPRTLFGVESDFVEKHHSIVREYKSDSYMDFNKEIKILTNDKSGKSGRACWFVTTKDNIPSGKQYFNKWKVVVSSANAGGQKRNNQLEILDNNSIFGRSRIALKMFDTEEEACNFYKYINSELIRFSFLMTDESLTSLAKQVPDIQDYSDINPYIDFTSDVNKQLYSLFEIDFNMQEYIRGVLSRKQ